jgi:hypothetical protein
VVQTVRIDHTRQVTVSQDGDHQHKSKTEVSLESTNFYATNFELGAILPTFIHRLSRTYCTVVAALPPAGPQPHPRPGDGFPFFARCLAYQFVALPPDTG